MPLISVCRKQARPFPSSTADPFPGAHAPWTKLALGKKSQPTDESECNSGDVTEKVTGWPHLPVKGKSMTSRTRGSRSTAGCRTWPCPSIHVRDECIDTLLYRGVVPNAVAAAFNCQMRRTQQTAVLRTSTARSVMDFAEDLPGVGPKGDQVVGCRDYLHGRAHKFNGAKPVHSTLGSATPTLTSKTSKVRRPMMCPVEEGSQSELILFECTGVVPVGRPSHGHGPPSEGCVCQQRRRPTNQ